MKPRFFAAVVAEFVVTVTISVPAWGLSSQPIDQPTATNSNEAPMCTTLNTACDKAATLELEYGIQDWLKFQQLVKDWNRQRGASSSITRAIMAPAYQFIIGMGPTALPLILDQLRSEGDDPDQWFWALQCITGEDPTRPEDQGNYLAMAKSWLKWAKDNNVG